MAQCPTMTDFTEAISTSSLERKASTWGKQVKSSSAQSTAFPQLCFLQETNHFVVQIQTTGFIALQTHIQFILLVQWFWFQLTKFSLSYVAVNWTGCWLDSKLGLCKIVMVYTNTQTEYGTYYRTTASVNFLNHPPFTELVTSLVLHSVTSELPGSTLYSPNAKVSQWRKCFCRVQHHCDLYFEITIILV